VAFWYLWREFQWSKNDRQWKKIRLRIRLDSGFTGGVNYSILSLFKNNTAKNTLEA